MTDASQTTSRRAACGRLPRRRAADHPAQPGQGEPPAGAAVRGGRPVRRRRLQPCLPGGPGRRGRRQRTGRLPAFRRQAGRPGGAAAQRQPGPARRRPAGGGRFRRRRRGAAPAWSSSTWTSPSAIPTSSGCRTRTSATSPTTTRPRSAPCSATTWSSGSTSWPGCTPDTEAAELRMRAHATFGLINSTPHSVRSHGRRIAVKRARPLLESMALAALMAPAVPGLPG